MNNIINQLMNDTDHVLIVDDDHGIRELLATYLEKEGMRTSAAANGRQMRAALEAAVPDLIVLDLMLPGEDGLALCRELRAGKHRRCAGPDADGARRRGGPHHRPGNGRGRLPRQAVRACASCWRASARCCAARGCCRPTCR
jgi:hypothetical protein